MTLGCGGARGPDCHQERREEGTLSSPSGDQCRGITTRAGLCPGLLRAMEFGPWSSPWKGEYKLASQRSERRSQETKDLAHSHGSRLTEPPVARGPGSEVTRAHLGGRAEFQVLSK